MSGSRTRTGCWTCRLRRKKCDENTPTCSNCVSRGLHCYGYGDKPAWMLDKQNWQQVLDSDEAKSIRNAAEGAYRRRRQKNVGTIPGVLVQHLNEPSSALLDLDRTWSNCTQPLRDCDYAPNYQYIHTFLDVIFPLQWGFYRRPSRRWLFDTIVACEPMYHASRGLCITFETGVKAGFTNGRCEVTPEVRSSRLMALRGLQPCIDEMQQNRLCISSLPKAVHSFATILQLTSLEIYGETEGLWEVHMNGAGTILDLIETQIAGGIGQLLANPIETPALDFFVATYVWSDILAEAAHGISYSKPRAFNYLPLLQRDLIDTQCIMGCRNSVMAIIKEVSIFAASLSNGQQSSPDERVKALTLRIQVLIQEEAAGFSQSAAGPEGDSNWVTLLHAHAALVYLQTVAAHQDLPRPPDVQQTVMRCLELLEALPSRLFIRVCWPFTVAGCTASEGYAPRFRAVLRRVEEDGQVLGFTWKGLIIMEECWRLRRCKPGSTWCWRTTMEHMRSRILLV
ncbi:fungal-specific transcription factor domain-containing protein [Ilyonectria robusta]|uniref:fungal-specific transcription factor domain-containing protein n=1 Tax=Ilyonectria robusta TaxID=1079257 RepID=UPI001E8E6B35|nr:fungal-specific transcription factor domain-containing protein [Ilyonectria robusta]KAH8683805.1 fungal-specific transcription factor domain-containing protein [Ilyonectria robusta]